MSKKVGYLGPKGTYSEYAASALAGDACLVPYANFAEVFGSLARGETDGAVIPIENTVNGAVTQNLDLLQQTDGVIAVSSYVKKIDHRLITLKGAELSKIKRVFSHPKALGQCSAYLAEYLPQAKQIAVSSTAYSVEKIASVEDAAIAGAHFCRNGYTISDHNISDEQNNCTTFLFVESGKPDECRHCERIFLSVTCRHEVGGLLRLLEVLNKHAINMTKIESRPIKDRPGEFRFFIEIEGDYASAEIRRAIDELKDRASSLKLLGCY